MRDTGHISSLGTLDFDVAFESFLIQNVATAGAMIHSLRGGTGPPLLLLHGYPQTHFIWHKVADRLAERYTVVLTDLRGYGDSSKPEGGAHHENYSFERWHWIVSVR